MSGNRTLATILFADIAGYTAMMQDDEAKGLETLRRFREELERVVPEHKGTIVQFFGDGCLMAFDEAEAGIMCAETLQDTFHNRHDIPVRMGLHSGKVLFRDNNAFGDTVNIASRVESLGVPGAVLVSKVLMKQLPKEAFSWKSLGAFEFKNVKKPMEVFALDHEGLCIPRPEELEGKFKEKKRVNKWIRAGQWLVIYLLACWALVQFLAYILPKVHISPHWTNVVQWALWGIVPSLFIYFLHRDRIRRRLLHWREKVFFPLNVFGLGAILYLAFGSTDLGATTTQVDFGRVSPEFGEQTILKEEFRTSIPIFLFDPEDGKKSKSWMSNGIQNLLVLDLNQDKHVTAMAKGKVRLSTVDKIANAHLFHDYFVDGTFNQEGDQFHITPTIRRSKNAEVVSQKSFKGEDLLAILDSASIFIRQSLGITKKHMAKTVDLPLKEYTSSSSEAVMHYMKGFESGDRLELEKATKVDSSFALAWLELGRINLGWNKGREEAQHDLEQAFRHRNTLPVDKQIEVLAFRHIANKAWKNAEKLVKLRLEIEPMNMEFNQLLHHIYGESRQFEAMLDHAKGLFEKEPNKVYGLMYLDAEYILGEAASIERKLKQYLILDPQNPYLLTLLMQVQTYQNKAEAAQKSREKVLLLMPEQEPIISILDSILDFQQKGKKLSKAELDALTGTYLNHLDEAYVRFYREGERLVSFFSNQEAHRVMPIGKDRLAGCSLTQSWHYHFYPNTSNTFDLLSYTEKSSKETRKYWFWKQDETLLKAKELLLAGRLEEARVLYEEALKKHPDHFYIEGLLQHIQYVQETPLEVLQDRLNKLAGVYTQHKIWIEDGKPYVKRGGRARASFLPVSKSRYFSFSAIGEIVKVEFEGDKPLGYRLETYDPERKTWNIGKTVIERAEE